MLMKSGSIDGTSKEILKQRKEDLLPVGLLDVIWPECQQPFSQKFSDSIADNFNWELLGQIVVCGPTKEGKYHIADGQNRAGAVKKRFGPRETVPCIIYPGDKGHAAWLFHQINLRRRKPKKLDLFRTAVIAGQEPESTINKAVKAVGFSVAGGANGIEAIRAVESLYRMGGVKLLAETLVSIRETWGSGEPRATDAIVISSFGAFLHSYSEANRKRLYINVAKEATPTRLIGRVRTSSDGNGITTTQAGKELLVRIYNSGLKSGRLGK